MYSGNYAVSTKSCVPFSVSGLMYTGSFHQLWEQFRAAIFVIIWSALITFILMKVIGLVLRGARYKDEILEVGDLGIHDEEAFPEETGRRIGGFELAASGAGGSGSISTNLGPPRPAKPGHRGGRELARFQVVTGPYH